MTSHDQRPVGVWACVFLEMWVGHRNRSGRGHLVSLGLGSKYGTMLAVLYLGPGGLFIPLLQKQGGLKRLGENGRKEGGEKKKKKPKRAVYVLGTLTGVRVRKKIRVNP